METLTQAGRQFWRDVLVAGGFTAIPRWSGHPVAGVAVYEAPVSEELVAALARLADELGVPLGAVWLAAHARVLAALSGEQEVTTGYAIGGRSLPCRLAVEPGSWRALVQHAARAETQLLTHADFPVVELRGELGLAGPGFETEFDPAGDGGELAEDVVLQVSVAHHGGRRLLRRGRHLLRLRYRTQVLDAQAAARIAGYHLRALELIAADPDAEHSRQSLLSAEELRFQIEGLAGKRRDLPPYRAHELFEQQTTAHPDTVAAVHGDRRWSYAELNARANRIAHALRAHALRARGLGREGVVAVVCERNLDWLAAVLAVFKAGGVYLPIEPHFPPERIATTLTRAGCALVLSEPGSTTTLDKALDSLPGVRRLLVDEAWAEDHPEGNLGVAVAPEQLAYIYFTSGSTGEPI